MSTFGAVEEPIMAILPRQADGRKRLTQTGTPIKPRGRPKSEPSTIVNVRFPVALLARLDRYLDRLEVQTGLKANRGMIARRALELFLETHEGKAPK
jgi:hypothetical protein